MGGHGEGQEMTFLKMCSRNLDTHNDHYKFVDTLNPCGDLNLFATSSTTKFTETEMYTFKVNLRLLPFRRIPLLLLRRLHQAPP
jgi:hypothetical protein